MIEQLRQNPELVYKMRLSATQLIIQRLANNHNYITSKQVANTLGVLPQSASDQLKRMTENGWLDRHSVSKVDGREYRYSI